MSNKLQQTKTIKAVLYKAKNSPRDEDGDWEDFNFSGDVGDALFLIGKEKIYELKEEIYPYLYDVEPSLRETAIRALGYGWGKGLHLPEFKDKAYDMWLNDPDPEVKEAAIDEWISYYVHSKDPIILKYLYNVIYSEQHSMHARVIALVGFMEVADALTSPQELDDIYDLKVLAGEPTSISRLEPNGEERINHMKMENLRLFNDAINKGYYLNKINSIMKKYVPGWKSQII